MNAGGIGICSFDAALNVITAQSPLLTNVVFVVAKIVEFE